MVGVSRAGDIRRLRRADEPEGSSCVALGPFRGWKRPLSFVHRRPWLTL